MPKDGTLAVGVVVPAPGTQPMSVQSGLSIAEVSALKTENKKLRDALQEIKDKYGKVCEGFELCKHESCASSYAAWAIADAALREK